MVTAQHDLLGHAAAAANRMSRSCHERSSSWPEGIRGKRQMYPVILSAVSPTAFDLHSVRAVEELGRSPEAFWTEDSISFPHKNEESTSDDDHSMWCDGEVVDFGVFKDTICNGNDPANHAEATAATAPSGLTVEESIKRTLTVDEVQKLLTDDTVWLPERPENGTPGTI